MPNALGTFRLGSEALSGTFLRAAPTAVVTGPTAVTTSTATVTVTWTYFSPIGRVQAAVRIRLQSTDGTVTLFDTGTIATAATSYTPAFTLTDQSTYQVVVNVYDLFDVSADAIGTFVVAMPGPSSYPDAAVGSVYEIGINGVGYMLADVPGTEFTYRRQTVPLDSPRFAQGDTPFSQAIDRYTFIGWADWEDGAGQKYRNRATSSLQSFKDSTSMNPFSPDGLTPLKITSNVGGASTYATPLATVFNDNLLVQTGAKQLTQTVAAGTTTAFSIAAAGTIVGLASDGTNWYAADGTGIWQGAGPADPGAAWSTVKAQLCSWTSGNRLAVAYATAPSTTPNTFSTLKPDGTEDVTSGRLTLQPGSTITSIVAGDGYVWFSVRNHQQGLVYAWKAGSTDAPFVAFEFPAGQYPVSLGFYLSNVFVRAAEPLTSGVRANIYRCATSTGKLVPSLVAQIESGADDHTVGGWAGNSLYAFFGWKNVETGISGVGAINLATGGWARWLEGSTTGNVRSLVSWNGRLVFTQDGAATRMEDATVYVPAATLTTDTADLGTPITKVFGELRIETAPLPVGWTMTVSYTLDGGNSFSTPFTFTTAGSTSYTANIDKAGQSIGLKITLTSAGGSTLAPVVKNVTIRAHPYGLADQQLSIPINCSDRTEGLNGAMTPDSGAGMGAARARRLESLVQTRVKYQDVDWDPANPQSTTWEIQAVDVRSQGVYARNRNQQAQTQIAIVIMRRTLK